MTTIYSVSTVFLVLTVANTWAQQKPAFCQTFDCPSFTATTFPQYELRRYNPASNWVATTVTSSSTGWFSTRNMFMKLYRYITGANAAGLRIDMTVPVLTKVETLPSGLYEITMMFYLTQANPPQPTDPEVFLVTRPSGDVYVRQFNKYVWAFESDYNSNLNELRNAIGDASQYNNNIYYKAGYNAPFYFGERHYEVWVDRL